MLYGSEEDEVAAVKSLSTLKLDDNRLKETVISYFMTKFAKLPEVIKISPLFLRLLSFHVWN